MNSSGLLMVFRLPGPDTLPSRSYFATPMRTRFFIISPNFQMTTSGSTSVQATSFLKQTPNSLPMVGSSSTEDAEILAAVSHPFGMFRGACPLKAVSKTAWREDFMI